MDKNICLQCAYHEVGKAHDGFQYVACTHTPYNGAWVKNIECPKNNTLDKISTTEKQ